MAEKPTDAAGAAPRDHFISAMRGVASSVSVVTTDGPAGRHGATVSAFASVSADPPTILVCLHGQSRIAAAVLQNARFNVNVLSSRCSDIANRFAGREDHRTPDRFADVHVTGAPGAPPRLEDATVFACRLDRSVLSGTHFIIIGLVHEVFDGEINPLTYRDGAYHTVIPADRAGTETQKGYASA